MNGEVKELIGKLAETRSLTETEYARLIDGRTPEAASELAERAVSLRKSIYGTAVFTRGLIEISNICRNDCLYCGIRRGNRNAERYRLSPAEILSCA